MSKAMVLFRTMRACALLAALVVTSAIAADAGAIAPYYQVYADHVERWKIAAVAEAKVYVGDANQTPSSRMAAIEGMLSKNDLAPQDLIFFLRYKYELTAPMGSGSQFLVVIEYLRRSPTAWGLTEVISFAHSNGWKVAEEQVVSAYRLVRNDTLGTGKAVTP